MAMVMRNNPLYRSCILFVFCFYASWAVGVVICCCRSKAQYFRSDGAWFIVLRVVLIYPRPSYFRSLWGLVYLLVLFLREDIDHFGFCLVRLLVGEVWLAAVDCFCGWFAEGRL